MLFADFKQVYDSVPRQAVWQVLEKCDISPRMLSITMSFHEQMLDEVRAGDSVTDSFEVRKALRQGCTLVPTLFNIHFIQCSDCKQAGWVQGSSQEIFTEWKKIKLTTAAD